MTGNADAEIHALRTELEKARARVRVLEEERDAIDGKLAFYEMHAETVGLKAEAFVVGLVGGRPAGNGKCDIFARNGMGLEIKFSNVLRPKPSICRWNWSNIFGRDDCKSYHNLILIGDAATKWRSEYKDPTSPYIYFDVPFHDARELTTSNGPRKRAISLNANPRARNSRATAHELFVRYQVTEAELVERYRRSDRRFAGPPVPM